MLGSIHTAFTERNPNTYIRHVCRSSLLDRGQNNSLYCVFYFCTYPIHGICHLLEVYIKDVPLMYTSDWHCETQCKNRLMCIKYQEQGKLSKCRASFFDTHEFSVICLSPSGGLMSNLMFYFFLHKIKPHTFWLFSVIVEGV